MSSPYTRGRFDLQGQCAQLTRELDAALARIAELEQQVAAGEQLGVVAWMHGAETAKDKLRADAELGQLVRAMPEGDCLCCIRDDKWAVECVPADIWQSGIRNTPEEVLREALGDGGENR